MDFIGYTPSMVVGAMLVLGVLIFGLLRFIFGKG